MRPFSLGNRWCDFIAGIRPAFVAFLLSSSDASTSRSAGHRFLLKFPFPKVMQCVAMQANYSHQRPPMSYRASSAADPGKNGHEAKKTSSPFAMGRSSEKPPPPSKPEGAASRAQLQRASAAQVSPFTGLKRPPLPVPRDPSPTSPTTSTRSPLERVGSVLDELMIAKAASQNGSPPPRPSRDLITAKKKMALLRSQSTPEINLPMAKPRSLAQPSKVTASVSEVSKSLGVGVDSSYPKFIVGKRAGPHMFQFDSAEPLGSNKALRR